MNILASVLVLFAIISIISISPSAFAEVTIITGSVPLSAPGCEETNECYTPGDATVDVGVKVIMTNTDSTGIHTFTSGTVDGFSPSPDGTFDSGMLNADQSFEWTPDTTGEYPYYCMLHTWMQGTITVQEAMAEEETMEEVMEEPELVMATVVKSDQMMAEIMTSDGIVNEAMTIDLTLTDLEGNGIEHITYNIKAVQGDNTILDEEGHMHKGTLTNNHVTSVLSAYASDEMPVAITVESVGFGHNEQYVEFSGEIAVKQVVPEFGTIAMMILAVAIISIVAVTAKSRVIPRF